MSQIRYYLFNFRLNFKYTYCVGSFCLVLDKHPDLQKNEIMTFFHQKLKDNNLLPISTLMLTPVEVNKRYYELNRKENEQQ